MVVVIGSLNLDQTVVVDRYPKRGETVLGLSVQETAGGKGGNVAAQAARLGACTRLLALVGADRAAGLVRTAQEGAGSDLTYLHTVPDLPTGTASIWVEQPSGENRIIVVPGANQRLDGACVARACAAGLLDGASWLVMNLEIPLSGVREGLSQAHARNIPVLLNRSPEKDLDLSELTAADVLVVNLPEASAWLQERTDSDPGPSTASTSEVMTHARALARHTPAQTIVTAGGQGVATSGHRGEQAFAALDVPVIDTTGAGDAFLGGLAFALDTGLDFAASLGVANLVGACAVTAAGALSSQPDRHALSRFAQAHGGTTLPVRGDGNASGDPSPGATPAWHHGTQPDRGDPKQP